MRDNTVEPTKVLGPGGDGGSGAETPEVGRPWGKFLIEKRLGSGGQANVFQAFDQLGTSGHVALKVPSQPLSPDEVQRWLEVEAGSLVKLVHPNIVRVADAGRIGSLPYVATALVDGLPLNERVRTDPPTLRRVLDWMIALADALGAAHARGIVHRDLKPLNVIITPDARPLLIDFGLASLVTAYHNEPRHDASGSYPFMAPEQARGDPEADLRVDVFGLGGILKYLLVGRGPYHGAEGGPQAASEGQVQFIETARMHGLRRRLARVANRAIDPSPARRYQNMREMARALSLIRFQRGLLVAACGAAALASLAMGVFVALGGLKPKPVEATMEVRLQRGDQVGSFQMLTADSLPLGPGDRIQVRVGFSEPLVPYLIVASPEAGATVLYPPDRQAAQRVSELQFPQGEEWYDLPAAGETRTVLLLASREPVKDLPAVLAGMGSAPTIGTPSLLQLDEKGLQVVPSTRARLVGQGGEMHEGFLSVFAQQGFGRWAVVRAVAFPYWGEEQRVGRLAGYVGNLIGRRPRPGPGPGPGPGEERPTATYTYRLADHAPGADSYMQAASRPPVGSERGERGLARDVWQGPQGYVEVGLPGPDQKGKGALGGEINGLKIEVNPSTSGRARLLVHSLAPADDPRYSAQPIMVMVNRALVGRGASAEAGKDKTDEFELDPSLLKTGNQQVLLSVDIGRPVTGATRVDWIELQLLPSE